MRALLIVFALVLSQGFSAEAITILKDDVFPWPWADQCPFPWDKIEGRWRAVVTGRPVYFDFDVINRYETGERFLFVSQLDRDKKLVARGASIASGEQKGVVAVMTWLDGPLEEGFYLHISAFTEPGQGEGASATPSCHSSRVKTAIKITQFGRNQDLERPVIIEKMRSEVRGSH